MLVDYYAAIEQRVAECPDTTLAELRTWLLAEHGVKVSQGAMWKTVKRARPDAQKKSQRAAQQDRPDVAQARALWREGQAELNPARLVFIDETWATTNMTRRYGRSRRGQRLRAAVPHGHWKTSTFVAALRHDGITAPCVIDGALLPGFQ